MKNRILIMSGGKLDFEYVQTFLEEQSFDLVVCADSGLNAAHALKLPVDYIMGDFDSVDGPILSQYRQGLVAESAHVQLVQYPPEKDFTDTQLVLEWALTQEPSEIVILGATGGRLDHFLANVNILYQALVKEVPTYIIDRYNKIYLIHHRLVRRRQDLFGKYISLQPLTEQVTHITLEGFKYSLTDFTMPFGTGLGVSNEIAEGADQVVVELGQGVLIVAETRDD